MPTPQPASASARRHASRTPKSGTISVTRPELSNNPSSALSSSAPSCTDKGMRSIWMDMALRSTSSHHILHAHADKKRRSRHSLQATSSSEAWRSNARSMAFGRVCPCGERDAALGYSRSEQKVLSPPVKTLWWGNAHAEQPSPPRRLFPFASSITPCPA